MYTECLKIFMVMVAACYSLIKVLCKVLRLMMIELQYICQ